MTAQRTRPPRSPGRHRRPIVAFVISGSPTLAFRAVSMKGSGQPMLILSRSKTLMTGHFRSGSSVNWRCWSTGLKWRLSAAE